MKVLSNITKVLSSSIITFSSNFIIGFILPLYLSVAEYGYYREFVLYFNFFYILNLGFNEGLYIKYGGKSLEEIDHKILMKEHNTSLVAQAVVSLLMIVAGFMTKNTVIIIFAITTFFANATYFHQLVQQALSEFSEYSKTNTIKGFATILTMLIALLLFKGNTHMYYVLALMFAQFLVFLYCEWNFYKVIKNKSSQLLTVNQTKAIFNIGLFVLLANFLRVLVGSIGQWLVQLFSNIEEFAQYSLAGSMLSVVLLVINAVAAVFYTVISKNKDYGKLNIIKNLLLIFGVASGLAYFVLHYMITYFIPDYISSLEYMKYLILCVPYLMVINVIATNLYKTNMHEKKYFRNMLFVLTSTAALIGMFYLLNNNPVSAAIGTTVTYILWYFVVTTITFPFLKNTMKFNLLLISHLISYLVFTSLGNVLLGMILYGIYSLAILVIYRQSFFSVIEYLKENK